MAKLIRVAGEFAMLAALAFGAAYAASHAGIAMLGASGPPERVDFAAPAPNP